MERHSIDAETGDCVAEKDSQGARPRSGERECCPAGSVERDGQSDV